MAYAIYKGGLCPRCGTNRHDWVDETGKGIEPPPYEATTVACYGCKALDEASGEIPSHKKSYITAVLKRAARGKERVRQWQMKKYR